MVGSREWGVEHLAFTISEPFSWFRQPLGTNLQPQATAVEVSSVLIVPRTSSSPSQVSARVKGVYEVC